MENGGSSKAKLDRIERQNKCSNCQISPQTVHLGSGRLLQGVTRLDRRRTLESVTCYGCAKLGHFAQDCESNVKKRSPQPLGKESNKRVDVDCYKCRKIGLSMCRHVSHVASTVACYRCGEIGHIARQCAKAAQVRRSDPFGEVDCYRCEKIGHIARNCKNEARRSDPGRSRDGEGGWNTWKNTEFTDYPSSSSGDTTTPRSRLAQPGSLNTEPKRSDRRGYVRGREQGAKNQDDRQKPVSEDLPLHPRVPQPGSGNGQQIRCDICGYGLASELSLEHHRKYLHPSSQPVEWRWEVLNKT